MPIRVLRASWIGFTVRLLGILAVLILVRPFEGDSSRSFGWWLLAGTAPLGVFGLFWGRKTRTQTLVAAASSEEADRAYSASFSLCAAYAESIALVGFVVVFVQMDPLPYLVTLPLSLFLLVMVAPRKSDVLRLRETMATAGNNIDIATALMAPRTWSARDEANPRWPIRLKTTRSR